MKKYWVWALAVVCGFTSCGSDDKPYVKPLNKLTKVTCTLEETGETLFATEITYQNDGKITNIRTSDGGKQQFIYVGSTLTVSDTQQSGKVEYTLSGSAITAKKVSKRNAYNSNVEYVSDSYAYHYTGSNLTWADWVVQWPNTDGLTYERKTYSKDEVFNWENGNAASFTKDKKVIEYTYGGRKRPENLPFRVIDTFSPTGFDVFSPLNLMMGSMNREMPEKAVVYTIPDASSPEAEYSFQYTTTFDDYLMSMSISELAHSDAGIVSATYKYTFEYNYESK